MRNLRRSPLFWVALLAALAVQPAWANSLITRAVVASGGGTLVHSVHSLRSAIAQPFAHSASSASFQLRAGFLVGSVQSPTAVEDEIALPTQHRLHGAHPNPFNPRTTIRFDLAADAARVQLRLYDLAGREVGVLLDRPLAAGRHAINWDGKDRRGNAVASGVYLCHLSSPEFTATSKLVLVR